MTTNHTPGPWVSGKEGEIDRAVFADHETAFNLAVVLNGGNEAQLNANTALIASAPDLLAACEMWSNASQARTYIPERERASWDELMLATNKAIARAKGVAP